MPAEITDYLWYVRRVTHLPASEPVPSQVPQVKVPYSLTGHARSVEGADSDRPSRMKYVVSFEWSNDNRLRATPSRHAPKRPRVESSPRSDVGFRE